MALIMSFALAVNVARAQTTLLDVRTGLHPHKTRVVLEVSAVASYEVGYVESSAPGAAREIIIDLKDASSRKSAADLLRRVEAIGVLDKITLEDNGDQGGAVRLHMTLRKPARVDKSYVLRPDHGRQYRLVFDLKAASAVEWARQVRLTAPPEPVPPEPVQPEPVQPKTALVLAPEPETVPPVETPLPPAAEPEAEPELQETETYDDVVTGESNFTLSGYLEAEGRAFTQSSLSPEPRDWTMSFALEPLVEYVSDDGASQFMFRPFGRVDVNDKDRSHVDIRALNWTGTFDRVQMTVGIDTVFWGVTESNHLVDIINQDDNLEDIDQEDKLGQPMMMASYDSDFGVVSVYLMTYFREKRYPGMKGRFRLPMPIDYSQTQYESGSDKWHTDWAVRWAHVIGNVDVGLYHFKGTNREPEFIQGADGGGNAVLIPRYNLIDQTGLDVQGTFNDILIKFEAIHRTGVGPDFWAMTGGFEYSFYGLAGGNSDIGLLAEYLYDDRGRQATTPFEDDLFMGMRWAANDIDGTEILVGGIFDLDSSAKFINFEGSRRIGESWKVTLDARFFMGVPVTDILYPQSRDDFFQIRVARYF